MRTAILGLGLALVVLTGADEPAPPATGEIRGFVYEQASTRPLAYANVVVVGTSLGAMSLSDGSFTIANVPAGTCTVKVLLMAFEATERRDVVVRPGGATTLVFLLKAKEVARTQQILVMSGRAPGDPQQLHVRGGRSSATEVNMLGLSGTILNMDGAREQYAHVSETGFHTALDTPLSTFAIDVDAASYSNTRRFVRDGRLPPPDAVRVEEFINYFDYDYPAPKHDEPFSVTTEVAECPWAPGHRLLHIGLQGEHVEARDMPPANLVFLIDVSGSMQPANKLPLLRRAFPLLVAQLRPQDRVAIVVYAGAAGLVLDSTPGDRKREILDAIERLQAGGSTAGGAGLVLAYKTAQENFIRGGNNRVILATDGDFNVGVSDDGSLTRLVEEKRTTGIFLTVLGVGEANLQDAKMESIADHGNGHYAYIDDILEAQKIFVAEVGATLLTIAKDVKIQVEFNPARVKSYRLIGYENRKLAERDFTDDKKDAGDMGAGHSVTALYEVVPAAAAAESERSLTFSERRVKPDASQRAEMALVRVRWKDRDADRSRELTLAATDTGAPFQSASMDFRFAAAVAELAMVLHESQFKGSASIAHVIEVAAAAKGTDQHGYRAEFVQIAEMCRTVRETMEVGSGSGR